MTVQFNLLPDIKIQYLKAKRQQHLVVLASVLTSIVAVTIFVLLLSVVYGLQKKNLNDLNGDITSASKELQGTKDLTKILTVQNQLKALPALHDGKVAPSRLANYLAQVTPNNVAIDKIDVDFTLNALEISGSAKTLTEINTYADSLKFTKFHTKSDSTQRNAFSSVVLSSFALDQNQVTYTITLAFEPTIFATTQEVELTVPQIISTRSEVDRPSALFQSTDGGQ